MDVKLEVVFTWSGYGLWKKEIEWITSWGVVCIVEEKGIQSAVLSGGRLVTEADVQYEKKDILNPCHLSDFSRKKSDTMLFNWLFIKAKGNKLTTCL